MRNKDTVRRLLEHSRYEVLPTATIEEKIVASVPTDRQLTVTASPAKPLDETFALTERLSAHGYDVVPHIAARMVSGRSELEDIVARLTEAGVTSVFVPGGDANQAGNYPDALSLLDQAIAHGAGKVEEAQVRDMLGSVDLDYLFSILDELISGNVSGMLEVADGMATRSLSFDAALQELASLLTRLQIAQLAPQSIADDLPERERLLALAAQLDPEFVQLAYQIAVLGRKELPLAPDEQAGFVMTLLRLYTFRPGGDGASAGQRQTPKAVAIKVMAAGRPAMPETREDQSIVVTPAALPESIEPRMETVAASSGSENHSVSEAAVVESPTVEIPVARSDDWHTILAALKLGGMARELGQHCEMRVLDGARIDLCLSPAYRHLQMKPAQEKLQQSLSEYFGRSMQMTIRLEEVVGETPAATAQRRRDELQERAVASVEQDGFVREVIDIFDATVIESSIKPV